MGKSDFIFRGIHLTVFIKYRVKYIKLVKDL